MEITAELLHGSGTFSDVLSVSGRAAWRSLGAEVHRQIADIFCLKQIYPQCDDSLLSLHVDTKKLFF